MMTNNMQYAEPVHADEDVNDGGGDVDIDAIMQTLGDQIAKNPEDDDEVAESLPNESEDDEQLMDVSNSPN